jgi:hypothetical protein
MLRRKPASSFYEDKIMRRIELLLGFLVILCSQAFIRADITTGYGTFSSTSTSVIQGDFKFDEHGGELMALAAAMENTYGISQAYSDTTGSSYLPNLKVRASSNEGFSASAKAFAVQGFSFSDSARDVQLNVNLHGSIINNPTGSSSNSLSASLAVLKGSELGWYPSFGTLVFEVAGATTQQLALGSAFLNTPGLDQNNATSMTFHLNPGDNFYVVAQLNANSRNGEADGFNTLSLSFTNASGITAVPEPSSFALSLAVIALAACHWRRRGRSDGSIDLG